MLFQELLQDTRYETVFARGMQMVEKRQIRAVDCTEGHEWRVPSQTRKGLWHTVRCTEDGWSCTCEAYAKGHQVCDHVIAAFLVGAALERAPPEGSEIPDLPERWCRFCGCTDCAHVEYRTLKRMLRWGDAETSRYRCRRCGRKFVDRPGFEGLHYSDRVVLSALGRVAEAESPAAAARTLKNDGMADVSGRTVQRWAEKYSALVDAFTSMLKLPHGIGAMSVDEKHFKRRGVGWYQFETISVKSRYVISHDTAKDKLNYDATSLFRRAVERAGKPLVLLSDKLRGFGIGHRNVMETDSRSYTLHFAKAAVNKKHAHNNRHERRNGAKADRMANTRGFNSNNPALLILNILHHNFWRPHMGLNGKTPAEVEGIIIPGDNKLHTLIRCAVARQQGFF